MEFNSEGYTRKEIIDNIIYSTDDAYKFFLNKYELVYPHLKEYFLIQTKELIEESIDYGVGQWVYDQANQMDYFVPHYNDELDSVILEEEEEEHPTASTDRWIERREKENALILKSIGEKNFKSLQSSDELTSKTTSIRNENSLIRFPAEYNEIDKKEIIVKSIYDYLEDRIIGKNESSYENFKDWFDIGEKKDNLSPVKIRSDLSYICLLFKYLVSIKSGLVDQPDLFKLNHKTPFLLGNKNIWKVTSKMFLITKEVKKKDVTLRIKPSNANRIAIDAANNSRTKSKKLRKKAVKELHIKLTSLLSS